MFSIRGDGLTSLTVNNFAASVVVAHATAGSYTGAVAVFKSTRASSPDFYLIKVSVGISIFRKRP